VEVYRAKIIDLTSSNMVVELTGKPSKIDGFLQVMAPYHVLEMCRSGIIGMPRGSQSDWWKTQA
jgi:acetolactate synthase-1/3 small subunit